MPTLVFFAYRSWQLGFRQTTAESQLSGEVEFSYLREPRTLESRVDAMPPRVLCGHFLPTIYRKFGIRRALSSCATAFTVRDQMRQGFGKAVAAASLLEVSEAESAMSHDSRFTKTEPPRCAPYRRGENWTRTDGARFQLLAAARYGAQWILLTATNAFTYLLRIPFCCGTVAVRAKPLSVWCTARSAEHFLPPISAASLARMSLD